MEQLIDVLNRLGMAHTTVLRELARALVEEGLLPPDRAARAFRVAADTDFPASESWGGAYDAGREEFLLIAQALASWPGSGRAPPGLRKDLG